MIVKNSRTWVLRLDKYSYIEGAEHIPSNWDITTEQDGQKYAELLRKRFERVRWCFEIGKKTNMPHWHYLVQNDEKKVRFETLKKLNNYAHIEAYRAGTPINSLFEYLGKDGEIYGDDEAAFKVFPEMKYQHIDRGCRTDWLKVRELLENGSDICDVLVLYPHLSLNVGALEKLRSNYLAKIWSKKLRKELEVTYISGEAGCGKSRFVLEKYGLDKVYRVTDYKHPFDGYNGQDVIVFEEFRNSLPFEQMLNFLDIYPCELPSRYANKVACYTKVYILSNWAYEQQYENIRTNHTDSIGAWDRRITSIFEMEKGGFITALKVPEYEKLSLFPC